MTITRRSMLLTPLAALAGKMFGGPALHHSGGPLLSWDAAKFIKQKPWTAEEVAKAYRIPVWMVMGSFPDYYVDRKDMKLLKSLRKRGLIERAKQ